MTLFQSMNERRLDKATPNAAKCNCSSAQQAELGGSRNQLEPPPSSNPITTYPEVPDAFLLSRLPNFCNRKSSFLPAHRHISALLLNHSHLSHRSPASADFSSPAISISCSESQFCRQQKIKYSQNYLDYSLLPKVAESLFHAGSA